MGWGEGTLEGHSEAVEGCFEDFRQRLMGVSLCSSDFRKLLLMLAIASGTQPTLKTSTRLLLVIASIEAVQY